MTEYKIGVVSLGCSKNRVDTEQMLAELCHEGYEITPNIDEAQLIIINTCAFIQSAKQESINTILEVTQRKKGNTLKKIIVTGCLPQRYRQSLSRDIPEVDGWIGVNQYGMIAEIVKQVSQGVYKEEYEAVAIPTLARILTTPKHLAYVNIAQGCDQGCSYCAIPAIRGRYHSRPMEDIVHECEHFAREGASEVVLIAQDTSYYGKDLYGAFVLPDLLSKLSRLHIPWIRLMYTYPERVTEALLDVMEGSKNIIPYLDIPLQHIEDDILKRMGRAMTNQSVEALLDRIAHRQAAFTLRTTFITGFPGESQSQHEALLRFISRGYFDHVGIFAYSQEEGTRAAAMSGQWDSKTKLRRRNALLRAQQQTAYEAKQRFVGSVTDVLLEGVDARGRGTGRTIRQAPEVDGVAYADGCDLSMTGKIVRCRITKANAYDFWGVRTDDSGQ